MSAHHAGAVRLDELRVLVVDDRPLMRAGLAAVLQGDPVISEVTQAGSIEAACAILDVRTVDVIIASPMSGDPIESNHRFCALASRAGAARVVYLSRDRHALPPACGRFVSVPENAVPSRFLTIVETSSAPARPCERELCGCRHTHIAPPAELTAQEARILAGLADGLSNRDIGASLGLAEKTVKNYVTRIFAKLGVSSRTAAIAALRDGVSAALH